MAAGFGVEGDDVCACFDKRANHVVHGLNHQVHINRRAGMRAQRGANHRPKGKVGHIVVVHHIKVNHVCAGGDDVAHFFAQSGEIGGKNAGGDAVFHGVSFEYKQCNVAILAPHRFSGCLNFDKPHRLHYSVARSCFGMEMLLFFICFRRTYHEKTTGCRAACVRFRCCYGG